ncbi:MAG: GntR family transcriptional regulator [Planctomyces sp.]|nr:GntR family transcriptional regulator [Planctomyces sp.]
MQKLPAIFEIQPSSGLPIYRQIIDQIWALIASGRWPAGTMLPSVRQMASELEINMMTVSKAYSRLERDGLVERLRGSGMRVLEQSLDGRLSERKTQLRPLAESLVTRGHQLQLTDEQIVAAVQACLEERRR